MDPQPTTEPGTELPAETLPDLLQQPEAIGGAVCLALAVAVVVWTLFFRARAPAPPAGPPPPEEIVEAAVPAPTAPPEGLVDRLRQALGRSRAALQGRFDQLFSGRVVDEALFEELETTLLAADVGMPTTTRLIDHLKGASSADSEPQQLRTFLREEMRRILAAGDHGLIPPPDANPWVILVVGVNGSGKTTTIGKLSSALRQQGRKVMLAAADTFRAAAVDQLRIWAERAEVDIVAHQEGADPGAVVYDALEAAKARGHDVVIVDTAGRLQTRKPLMEQLSKIRRVIDKVVPGGPHETLLVVDGTMGQNALSQAQLFNDATPLTGVVITKLDGTAKGGMVLTLAAELGLPVKLIGIGEKVDDLKPFDPDAFVEALT